VKKGAEQSASNGYVRGLRLYKGPRGESYYYHFKFNNEGYSGSCDTTSLREATAFLEALKTELRGKKKRQEHTRLSLPKLSKVYADWLEEMQSKATPEHLKSVESYWTRHIEPHLGHLPLNLVSTAAVEGCRAKYLEGGGTNGGANSLLITLNTFFGWAIRHRIIANKPYQVAKLRVQRVPRSILAGPLAARFLAEIDKARNPHVRLAVRMMLGLGLREKEALSARWEWLDLHRMTYTPGKTKGCEAVALDVPEWLAGYLQPLKKSEGLMIPMTKRPKSRTPQEEKQETPHVAGFTKKAVARAAKAVSIPRLTPHRLRATFATLHADAGTPTTEIQAMLRHKQITTTLRYVESGRQSQRDAQRKVAEAMGLQKAPAEAKVTKPVTKKTIDNVKPVK